MTSDRIGAGQRLADTLRRIRESRGIDLTDFVARTKVAPDIVAEFETNCLVSHPRYNRVYLRPFVQQYAEAIEVSPEKLLRAIDAALEGRYDSTLAVEILGDVPEESPREIAIREARRSKSPSFELVVDDQGTKDAAKSKRTDSGALQWLRSGKGDRRPFGASSVFRKLRSDRSRSQGAAASFLGALDMRLVTFWAATIVIIVLAVVFWPFSRTQPVEPPVVPVVPSEPEIQLPARVVVADTMLIWVIAVDTLNPIRVTVDDRPRAPYWIEKGDSLAFAVTESILFEREANQIALSYDGRRVPTSAPDSSGRFLITRRRVQELLDSLRTAN